MPFLLNEVVLQESILLAYVLKMREELWLILRDPFTVDLSEITLALDIVVFVTEEFACVHLVWEWAFSDGEGIKEFHP